VTVPDLPGALSPLVALAAAARATNTIRLGTFVLNTGLWNPATVARELATLDQVSGGRLEITLGSGIPQASLQGIIPPSREGRFERLQATVAAVTAAIDAPGITPGFAARPRLFIAGGADRTLRLAAEQADGFIIASVPPVPKIQLPPGQLVLPEPAAAHAFLDRLRSYAGQRADQLVIGTGVEVILTDNAAVTAERLAAIHTYLSPEQVRSSPKILIGTPEEIAAQILERGQRLGLTYYVMRGAAPEELGAIIARVRASGPPGTTSPAEDGAVT
jgi:alkanesulfonate monooxygenase SsuD/methylene tetrahydromethanopterin reductase-like flavin-dependent oxidoreductase (luciferase family)